MKIWILDTEANSLTPDKFWVVVLKEFLKDNYVVFINDHYCGGVNDTRDILGVPTSATLLPISKFKEWITQEITDDNSIRIVGHNNIDYDFHWIKELFAVDLFHLCRDIRDTYVLSRLASPKRSGGHSVEAWGERFGLAKVQIDNEQWATFDPIMVPRCVTDVMIQERIYDHLRTQELRGFSARCIDIEQNAQRIVSEQKRDGVYIDRAKTEALYGVTKSRADRYEREIQSVFPPKPKLIREYNPKPVKGTAAKPLEETKDGRWAQNTIGPVGRELGAGAIGGPYSLISYEPFNVSSPIQRVKRLLELGWEPTEFTKPSKTYPEGQPKFTEDSLESLPEDAPQEIRLIGKYLMTRNRQAFCQGLLDGIDDKGYIHGYIDILGAGTHRMASNSPNLQNVAGILLDKQEKPILGEKGFYGYECRDLFRVEHPNVNIFVDADASGIQLRGLAHYGGDSEYIALVSDPGIDIHRIHADVLGCTRAVAKTFIYALLMGAGAKKLATVLGSGNIKLGRDLLELFYERFPFLKELKKRLDKEVEMGYTTLLDGRLCALNSDMPHLAMSVILQSFEAIIIKWAMWNYQKKLRKENIWFKQRLVVHDEYLTETKRELGDVVGKVMVQSIRDAGVELGSKCPLDGQYKLGTSWTIH